MAKKIKVIKCPQCGNTKSTVVGDQHYRCDQCGSEFFLDNDDINVNINHRYEHSGNKGSSPIRAIIAVCSIIAFFIIFVSLIKSCISSTPRSQRNITTSQPKTTYKQNTSSRLHIKLISIEGKAIAFYFEFRENRILKDKDKEGLFAIFYDLEDKKIIKEDKISNSKSSPKIDERYFPSEKTYYFILDEQFIYKIVPNEYNLKNITKDIAAAKPALNSGFSSIYFIQEKNGDGFRLTTNLGKEFYYFPGPDMLCTDKAYHYIANGGMKTVSKEAKDISYYLFLNKESKVSSNVAQLYKITYKYNNGGPENKMLELSESNLKRQDQFRIVSTKSITDDLICFSPKVLYSDDSNILISYKTTLAEDATTNIQLLNATGDILWTTSFNNIPESENAIKTDKGFTVKSVDNRFYNINNNGEKGSSSIL